MGRRGGAIAGWLQCPRGTASLRSLVAVLYSWSYEFAARRRFLSPLSTAAMRFKGFTPCGSCYVSRFACSGATMRYLKAAPKRRSAAARLTPSKPVHGDGARASGVRH